MSSGNSNVNSNQLCLRVKRGNQTYFVLANAAKPVTELKTTLHAKTGTKCEMKLYYRENIVLEDNKTLTEQKIDSDGVLYMVCKKEDGEFEQLKIL